MDENCFLPPFIVIVFCLIKRSDTLASLPYYMCNVHILQMSCQITGRRAV